MMVFKPRIARLWEGPSMRLFIAIEFPEWIREALSRDAALLRPACERGRFSRKENYHVTLAFLGETASERVPAIVAAMEEVSSPPPVISVGDLGMFRSREGNVLYRAVENDERLWRLQRRLSEALSARGFVLEERAFSPHLTMARRAQLRPGETLEALSARLRPARFTAREMTLLLSEQREGARVYMPLYQKSFTDTKT